MRVTLNLPAFIHITCSSFSGGISSLSWLLPESGLMHSSGFHSIRTELCWMQKDSPEWRCNFVPNMRDRCLLLSQRMPPRFQHQHRPITVTCNLASYDPALLLGLIPGSFSHIFQLYYTSFPTSNLHLWYPENQIKILDVFSLSLCASWNLSRKWIQLSWFKWETFNKENIYRGVGGDKGINKGWWGSQKPAAEGSFITLRTGEQEKEMMTQELSESWSHWEGAAPGGMEPLRARSSIPWPLSPALSSLRHLPLVKPNQNPTGMWPQKLSCVESLSEHRVGQRRVANAPEVGKQYKQTLCFSCQTFHFSCNLECFRHGLSWPPDRGVSLKPFTRYLPGNSQCVMAPTKVFQLLRYEWDPLLGREYLVLLRS